MADLRSDRELALRVRGLEVAFGERAILKGVDLDLYRGEILGLVGASGSGKSVLTRTILGLIPKRAGTIEVLGRDLDSMTPEETRALERKVGVLFQFGALFSSLTVRENIQLPMREHLDLSERLLDEIAALKLDMVGLSPDVADKMPAELSGGMVKRAALARALALDPEILFLDEPTSGLDPIGAGEFDLLIGTLQRTLELSVLMVTHDLDSLATVCDRIAAIAGGKIAAVGTLEDMVASADPWVSSYFSSRRSNTALGRAEHGRNISDLSEGHRARCIPAGGELDRLDLPQTAEVEHR